ncbi:MAG TPA: hypothetical protein VFZ89_04695, partial [Solirubrobacteraceae bacterium]
RALGAGERVQPDAALTTLLAAAAGRAGVVQSSDVYGTANGRASAEDLSTAAILQLARVRGIRVGAILAVVDGEADEATITALGEAAAAALVGA